MKRFLLLLPVLVVFTLTGCNKPESPETVVSKFLEALTTEKYDETVQYTEIPLFNTEEELEFLNLYFPTMTYSKPVLVSKDETNAVVSVELTAKDIDAILQALFTEILQKASEDPDFDMEAAAEELDQQMIETINSPDAPVKSMALQLNLMLLDKDKKKQWVIIADDVLEYGLYLQEPQEDYTDYQYSEEPEMEVLESKTAKATYMGSDDVAGLCSFVIEGDLYHMYCADEELRKLEADYLNKEVQLSYDILSSPELEATGDTSLRLYVLTAFE